jgi:hypothetical protein
MAYVSFLPAIHRFPANIWGFFGKKKLKIFSDNTSHVFIRNGFMPHIMGHKLSHIYAREVR